MQRARCAHRLPTLGPATPVAWAQPVPSKGEAPSRNEDGAPGLDPCICSVGRTPCSPDVPLGPEHPGRANPVRGGPLREAGKRPLFFAPELAAPPPARTTPTTPAPSACIAKRDMREAERVALPHRAASSSRHLHGPPFDDHREPGGLEGRGRHARVPPDLRQLRRNCLRGRGHVLRARDPGKHLGLVRVRACSRCPPRWCCCSCWRGLAGDAVPLRRRGNPCRGRVPWRARRPAGRAWGSGCPDSAEAVLLHNVTNVAARSDAQQGPRSRRMHEAGTPERRTMQMHR